jgi:hypothetical protein
MGIASITMSTPRTISNVVSSLQGILTSGAFGGLDSIDFQKKFLWNVIMPSTGAPDISVRASAVRFGTYKYDEIDTMDWGNRKLKYPGKIDVQDAEIEFMEGTDSAVATYLMSWYALSSPTNGAYLAQNHFKKDIYVNLLDYSFGIVCGFTLIGCFIKAMPDYDLSFTENDILRLRPQFSVDDVGIRVNGVSETKQIADYILAKLSGLGNVTAGAAARALLSISHMSDMF